MTYEISFREAQHLVHLMCNSLHIGSSEIHLLPSLRQRLHGILDLEK
jgi:hypothetical protein